ncbi:hypothetical protein [Mesoflavibacter zeaxanthinifaciens]|uniref:hypothetical protein n=1 Tax=Mesoflavibacter zeaxanthinifaciens TaxID=393060 RepID=UPI003A8F2757
MKQIKTSALIILLFMSFTTVNAQLFKKVKKAGKSAKNVIENTNGADKVLKSAKGNIAVSSSDLKLDWSEFDMAPAITLNSLLYGTSVSTKGETTLNNYTASFIPHTTANGTKVNTIGDQDKYLKIKVYKGDNYITYFEYSGSQTFADGKLTKFNTPSSRYQIDGEWIGDTAVDVKKWGEGMYRLDFYAGDKMFYSFDFEIYKLKNNDAYSALNEMYLTRGPWNDYAYLNHAENGNLVFGFYLNHEEFYPNPSNHNKLLKPVKWGLKLFKDNKLFAQHYGTSPNVAHVDRADWKEFSCAMKVGEKGSELKFSSLTDGAYKIEVTMDSEPSPRIYKFNVVNNQIQLIPEQDRAKNPDPTRLIEGWNNYVWLKLEK